MKKILKFIKDNLLISTIVIIIVLIILVVFITLVKRGTFGLDNANSVTLDCQILANSPSEVECDIKISYDTSIYNDNNKILSVNANYDLPNGVEYVSYLSNCTDCDIDEQSENGFAIVRLKGLANNFVIGKVKLSIHSDIESGTEYTIGLKNIEFSDDEGNMIEVANSSDTYIFGAGHLNIDSSISVDKATSIIYNLADNTDYSDLLNKIDTSGEIKIYDKNNNVKSGSDLMKTTDKLVITFGSETITYTISVLGDMNNDGKISVNDVSKLYQLNKTFETSPPELIYIFTGDMNHDGTYSINDVSKLYQISKQRAS